MFFTTTIHWYICCYSICHFCWYSIHNRYNFITLNHWSINNTFKVLAILTNTCARIATIIFFALAITFTFTLTYFIIPFLIWITCCTIGFAFTITNVLASFLFFYHFKCFNIYIFCLLFLLEHIFLEIGHFNFQYIYLK